MHAVYCILSTTVYRILYTVYCMLYSVYCMLYTVHCILLWDASDRFPILFNYRFPSFLPGAIDRRPALDRVMYACRRVESTKFLFRFQMELN